MAEFELSCGLPPGPDFADLAVLAEQLGYTRVWIYDSAPLWEDPFVHLALAAQRTSRIGLGTAVLIPTQRDVMAMASAIATIARLSGGRFRPCFGTGFTARLTVGQPPMKLGELGDYVRALRRLLAGGTTLVNGKSVRMLHADGLTQSRPVNAPLWLSVFGPRGAKLAAEIADGIIGPFHPDLPTATLVSGTVLDMGENPGSDRVRHAIGPWRVLDWHNAYAYGGAEAVDALPGGRQWRDTVEALEPAESRHLLTFEGHVTHLPERDRALLEHIDHTTVVGDLHSIRRGVAHLVGEGFSEVIYTPSGPDTVRELTAFAAVGSAS
ncbi:LLM class flavin-dependent oxidoreductase [Streptomyces sp. NBC_00986]|uniref:LLM class flavin-dependent oxidoreductase n=1 Tax=Streptomyces sp. NBC_00986 TaxID=2903702 RepID=UPI00386B08B0|nr:LLM class flavin-dependent oxidoreductase [Streptomyces sp. NBC_00986]